MAHTTDPFDIDWEDGEVEIQKVLTELFARGDDSGFKSLVPASEEVDLFAMQKDDPRRKRHPRPKSSWLDELNKHSYAGREMFDIPQPAWLVRGLVPEGAVGMLYGPSGSGKSWIAVGIALAVADPSTDNWYGHPVGTGDVLYIAAEGGSGMARRVESWYRHRGLPDDADTGLVLVTIPVDLGAQEAVAALTAFATQRSYSLIVIDTLARSIPGKEENSATDMGLIIDAVSELTRKTGAAVLLVHHTGKDERSGARGSSALKAAFDFELALSGYISTGATLQNTKQKDAENAAPLVFVLSADAGTEVPYVKLETERPKAEATEQRKASDEEAIVSVLADTPGIWHSTNEVVALLRKSGHKRADSAIRGALGLAMKSGLIHSQHGPNKSVQYSYGDPLPPATDLAVETD